MANPIPEGLEGRIVPYLMIDGAAAAIDFSADELSKAMEAMASES